MLPNLDKIIQVIWTMRKQMRNPWECPELTFSHDDMDRLADFYCAFHTKNVSVDACGVFYMFMNCSVVYSTKVEKDTVTVCFAPGPDSTKCYQENGELIKGYVIAGNNVKPILFHDETSSALAG